MVEAITPEEYNLILSKAIPEKYLRELINFLKQKRYGTLSFIIQDGKIIGCDILNKDRLADR